MSFLVLVSLAEAERGRPGRRFTPAERAAWRHLRPLIDGAWGVPSEVRFTAQRRR
jgi:hypothetical protein